MTRALFLLPALFFATTLWSPLLAPVVAQTPAQTPALTLSETLARAETRGSVVTARRELEGARDNLGRVARDPLAVRADLVQAKQCLASPRRASSVRGALLRASWGAPTRACCRRPRR